MCYLLNAKKNKLSLLVYVYVLLLYQDNNLKWQGTWYIRPEFLKIIPLKGLESNILPTSRNWLTLEMKFIDFISSRRPVNVNYNLDNEKISSFHLERHKRFCAWSATLTCNKRVLCTTVINMLSLLLDSCHVHN